jgi:diguanylate cyclase (GGDEF)-like protein
MVVAPGTDRDGAEVLAERLRENVDGASTEYNGQLIRMTISLGFAVAEPGCPAGFDQLREAAAEGLKEAKETGRNRSVLRTVGPLAT